MDLLGIYGVSGMSGGVAASGVGAELLQVACTALF